MLAAAAAGLSAVALTDHDTTAGWAAADAARPTALTLLRGAELSCRWHGRDGDSVSLHLLAYLFDPDEPRLADAMRAARESRELRGRRMVEALVADRMPVSWEQVERVAAGAPVGRPHVARALVEAGLVPTISAAFAPEWLGERYRRPKADMDAVQAVRWVLAAGGVPVMAHPRAGRRGRVIPAAGVADLAAAGLLGLEADHPDHDRAETVYVRRLASELGLFVTGASDYHGRNKAVELGEYTTGREAYERIASAATGVPALP
jgi:predicted metal-dependent phosphoesterase TrpH